MTILLISDFTGLLSCDHCRNRKIGSDYSLEYSFYYLLPKSLTDNFNKGGAICSPKIGSKIFERLCEIIHFFVAVVHSYASNGPSWMVALSGIKSVPSLSKQSVTMSKMVSKLTISIFPQPKTFEIKKNATQWKIEIWGDTNPG